MNAIVRWCLERRSVVLLATVLIVLAGAYGATQLRQQYFPPVDFPFLVVNTSAPGLSAQQIDEQVAQPLERAVRSLEDIEGVQTIASEGQAQVFIQLAYGTDADEMREDILAAMNQVPLPEEAEQLEAGGGFADQPIFNASISTSGDRLELSRVAEEVRDEIETLEGVARVELAGGVTRRVQVELKPKALQTGVNPTVLASQIRSALSNQPVGAVRSGGAVTPLVIEARAGQTLRELRRLEIADGQRLSDVARVSLIANSGESFARTNGKPAITLNVYRTDRADEVAITEAADEKLQPAREQLGAENVTTIFETGSDIKKSIRGLLLEGILGAVFAVVVIFAFLRSARPTLVAAASIPTSIVFGLLAAWMLGLSLNIITLGGLTIAIGRVIDDAIVVLENIYKHLERGETRVQAAIRGTSEVSVAIGSSTIATAAVFLPIGLIGGFISEIFFSFSIIVVVALLASFVVAVTLIPVLGAMLLRPPAGAGQERESRLSRLVTPATSFGLRHRVVTILGAVVLFGAALGGVAAGLVPIQFLPDSGTNQVFGTVKVAPGTSTERLQQLVKPLEAEMADVEGIEDYQVSAGEAAFTGDPVAVNSGATFFMKLKEDAPVERSVEELRKFGEKRFPEGFEVRQVEQGPPVGTFEVTISGQKEADIIRAAERIDRLARSKPYLNEVDTNVLEEQEQLVVRLKPDAPAFVSATQVQAALGGLIRPAGAGTIGNDLDVEVRLPDKLLRSPEALEDLPLPGVSVPAAAGGAAGLAAGAAGPAAAGAAAGGPGAGVGGAGAAERGAGAATPSAAGGASAAASAAAAAAAATSGAGAASAGGAAPAGASSAAAAAAAPTRQLRIGDVADVVERTTRAQVFRVDGDLSSITTGRIDAEDTNARIEEIRSDIADLDLQGIEVSYEGEASFIDEMFRDLGLAMAVAIVLVYLVLVVFFGSITQPITILAPILFSTIGSLIALIITGRALGLPAMIGQLLLIGIVVANSILLVDTALRLRREGYERDEALREAARLRVRPVLMTALATIAALLPLAIGISGEGGIISQSLGTVVIGGLLTATLLTLVIVPAVFTIFDRGRKGRAKPEQRALEEDEARIARVA